MSGSYFRQIFSGRTHFPHPKVISSAASSQFWSPLTLRPRERVADRYTVHYLQPKILQCFQCFFQRLNNRHLKEFKGCYFENRYFIYPVGAKRACSVLAMYEYGTHLSISRTLGRSTSSSRYPISYALVHGRQVWWRLERSIYDRQVPWRAISEKYDQSQLSSTSRENPRRAREVVGN